MRTTTNHRACNGHRTVTKVCQSTNRLWETSNHPREVTSHLSEMILSTPFLVSLSHVPAQYQSSSSAEKTVPYPSISSSCLKLPKNEVKVINGDTIDAPLQMHRKASVKPICVLNMANPDSPDGHFSLVSLRRKQRTAIEVLFGFSLVHARLKFSIPARQSAYIFSNSFDLSRQPSKEPPIHWLHWPKYGRGQNASREVHCPVYCHLNVDW